MAVAPRTAVVQRPSEAARQVIGCGFIGVASRFWMLDSLFMPLDRQRPGFRKCDRRQRARRRRQEDGQDGQAESRGAEEAVQVHAHDDSMIG